ncbi:MAG: molybdopterin biosynthesis protein [Thermodesulfobacteriota bacterium]|nr:molybdopterin biosynthesis protein [Thermodesulfobacteriota bacterium]
MGLRKIYLEMKTLAEAQEIFFNALDYTPILKSEKIPAAEALDRITAEAVYARFSSPSFHSAAMDGIAVLAEDTYGASEGNPKQLTIGKDTFFVNTGHILPPGTNAVIMIEEVHQIDEKTVEIQAPAHPWKYVRKVGEDIVATELILPQNHRITPFDIGALLAGGIFTLSVKKKPRVVIIPTGSELIAAEDITGDAPRQGKIIEYNSHILAGLVKECGAIPIRHEIISDDYDRIKGAVQKACAADYDCIIINAGSSAGSEDYTYTVIKELGRVLVHGVTIMPGKPTILGIIAGKPVIGNPGYPVSAVISFDQFVRPILYKMLGIPPPERPRITARPARKIPSKLGMEEFLRVNVGRVGDTTIATPLPRGAGSITTLTRADGILRVPHLSEGINADEKVEIELLREAREIANTLVIIGSHDLTIDVLANEIKKRTPRLSLSSSHVGSTGGLLAIGKGMAHMAGSHLFDPETGEYNIPYIKKIIPDVPVKLVNLVYREQGLIVPKGNPKGIQSIHDLRRKDIGFINRQAGSGTRILLDFQLKKLGVSPAEINGYEREEYTHMSVAVDVLSGSADVGLGIYAAARALGLDFISVVKERYDLVIPAIFWDDERIRALMAVIMSPEFKEIVEQLGGYDTSRTGELIWTS